MYYINYFFIFSILGHFIETFFYSNGESGILFGWWTPVYGIGTIIILLINKYIERFKFNKYLKVFTLFISSAILLSIIEAIGGYLIKWIFDMELWNYSNFKFNIGEYAAIEMALVWGISSIVVIYFLKPIFDYFIGFIPKYITYIFIGLFVVDLITTVIIKSNYI